MVHWQSFPAVVDVQEQHLYLPLALALGHDPDHALGLRNWAQLYSLIPSIHIDNKFSA
jgi:hypothetical protein